MTTETTRASTNGTPDAVPDLSASADHAKVSSDVPGRIRIRLHKPLRHNHLVSRVHQHLEAQAGVREVESNAATGSVVVKYDPKTHSSDDILGLFRDIGVIVADLATGGEAELPGIEEVERDLGGVAEEPGAPGHSKAALSIVDAVDDLNQRVSRFTNGHVDLKLIFPLAMGAVGVAKVLRDGWQLAEIPGYVLLWYAFDAFYKLHRQPPDQLASTATNAAQTETDETVIASSQAPDRARPARARRGAKAAAGGA